MNTKIPIIPLLIAAGVVLGVTIVALEWKSSKGIIKPKIAAEAMAKPREHKPVSYIEMLSAAFKDIRLPKHIALLVNIKPEKWTLKQTDTLMKWAQETSVAPLYVVAASQARLLSKEKNAEGNNVLGYASYAGIESKNEGNPAISDYFYQQAQKLSEEILEKDPNNIEARQAKILVMAEYDQNKPMEFLSLLRETIALDSSNVTTHSIHLELLKKTGQWAKALEKCKKLVSLQPQNSAWLFETSNIYGNTGDTANARKYMQMAVQKQKQENN